jgi:hypothetical protein
MKGHTMLVVSPATVVAGELVVWDDDEYQSVRFTSPDGSIQLLLAGESHDLRHVLQAALGAAEAQLGQ